MNKDTFLGQLKKALSGLPESEKREILYDYEEHFRIGVENGKSEEQIAAALGNPRVLGKSYRIDALLGPETEPAAGDAAGGRRPTRAGRILRAVLASVSLGTFNALFVVGPFVAAVAVLISLWATAASLALSGVAVLLGLVVAPFVPQIGGLTPLQVLFGVLAAAGIGGLGVLAGAGMLQLTRWFWLGIEKYVRFNLRIIRK